jgi:hypothetical protein
MVKLEYENRKLQDVLRRSHSEASFGSYMLTLNVIVGYVPSFIQRQFVRKYMPHKKSIAMARTLRAC